MAKSRKHSRLILTGVGVVVVVTALLAAFWPSAQLVDMGTVTRGPMQLTINEEGRTRVRESYVVSTPVAGQLQRVGVHPGDPVVRGETIVAHMRPVNPAALDVRTREQARAAVTAAQAALRVAQADLSAAQASKDLAEAELARTRQLVERQISSHAALDRARQNASVAAANVEMAEAAIAMREAEIANAQARLIGFDDQRVAAAIGTLANDIPIYAPADGRILKVLQESETSLPVGSPIVEIGNIADDLEVVVDLLSTDAVKVTVGDAVIIGDWGRPADLMGEVLRIDPFGVTKFSALGVEEQRVNVVIALTSPSDLYNRLGHGFRVEVRIIVWSADNTLTVPASALFRDGDHWAVFVVIDGVAQKRRITLGPNNGILAQVIDGLTAGETVILYPSSELSQGVRVAARSVERAG